MNQPINKSIGRSVGRSVDATGHSIITLFQQTILTAFVEDCSALLSPHISIAVVFLQTVFLNELLHGRQTLKKVTKINVFSLLFVTHLNLPLS